MDELRNVEYLPEPHDPRVVSAVDPSIEGYDDQWRSSVTGWFPRIARPFPRIRRPFNLVSKGIMASLIVILMLFIWRYEWFIIEIPPPTSEWAYDDNGIRDLQEVGLNGSGIRVCMVDTGIDLTHDAFDGVSIVFKDLIQGSSTPQEYGAIAHGTLMSGILIAQNVQLGVAPSIDFAMVVALQEDENGKNTGEESVVADAIRWCDSTFNADIISLSLGGMEQNRDGLESETVSATRQVTDKGIFVVAAAGNDGGVDDDGDVSSPGTVDRVITVGAHDRFGRVWSNSSIGKISNSDGDLRVDPHKKPEILAPGVQVVSTGENNAWYSSSGTSDSTVFVSGTLALLLQEFPQFRASSATNGDCIDTVKRALMQSTMNNDGEVTHDLKSGYGMLDAMKWYEELEKNSAC